MVFFEELAVLRDTAGDAFPPHAEAGRLHFLSHELNDIRLGEACLFLDLIESAAIFPRHADDLVALLVVHENDFTAVFQNLIGFLK